MFATCLLKCSSRLLLSNHLFSEVFSEVRMLSVAGTCNILMLLLELNIAVSTICIADAVSEFMCVLRVRCTDSINKLFQGLRYV